MSNIIPFDPSRIGASSGAVEAAAMEINAVDEVMESIPNSLSNILSVLGHAIEDAPDFRSKLMAQLLYRTADLAFNSIYAMIDKLQSRPAKLAALAELVEAASDKDSAKAARRAIAGMLVQHPVFDAEVMEIRQMAVIKEEAYKAVEEGNS